MKTKRIFCAVLALGMLLSLAVSIAEGYLTYVVTNTMKVYKYPNQLSRVMGTMSYGEDVHVLTWKDGWLKVQNDKGQIGYCEFGGLSTRNPNNLNIDAYVKEAGAYVFAKPGTGYKSIGAVTMGQQLDALAMTPDDEWVRVSNGKRIGYIQADKLSKTPTSFHSSLNRVWVVSDTAVAVSSSKNIASGKLLGRASHGEWFELLDIEETKYTNGSARIRNSKGEIGWIDVSAISSQNPNNMSQTMYAVKSGLLLSNGLFAQSGKTHINRGDPVTVVSVTPNNKTFRVKKGSKYYYIAGENLSTESPV